MSTGHTDNKCNQSTWWREVSFQSTRKHKFLNATVNATHLQLNYYLRRFPCFWGGVDYCHTYYYNKAILLQPIFVYLLIAQCSLKQLKKFCTCTKDTLQIVQPSGYGNMTKPYLKKKKVLLIKKSYDICDSSVTHNSPRHLRLFSTMRNEVRACRFLRSSLSYRTGRVN